MASQTFTQLVDDLSGEAGDDVSTVKFSAFGTDYVIELSAHHQGELEAALEPFVTHGRRVSGKAVKPKVSDGVDPKTVRAWAIENGIDVPPRGRIKREIVQQYIDAA